MLIQKMNIQICGPLHLKKNSSDIYPLVNCHITMENHIFMGKSTISMAIFNSFLYVYQRVPMISHDTWNRIGSFPIESMGLVHDSTTVMKNPHETSIQL